MTNAARPSEKPVERDSALSEAHVTRVVTSVAAVATGQAGSVATYLSGLCFLTAPFPQIDQALVLEGGIQLNIHGTLVEDPLDFSSAFPWELYEK